MKWVYAKDICNYCRNSLVPKIKVKEKIIGKRFSDFH